MAKTESTALAKTGGQQATALVPYSGGGYNDIRDLAIPDKREAVMSSALANFAG